MNARHRHLGLLECNPLDLHQARLLVRASPAPALVADVVDGGFDVLAVDPLLRRFVVGAVHPAGPRPGELITIMGLGMLGPEIAAAAAMGEPVVTELPIGDEPLWFELRITPIVVEDRCVQVVVIGADRTADHGIEQRQRRFRRRFVAMFEHAPGLVLLVDSAARIVRSSPGLVGQLGRAPDTLVGRQVFEVVHPDDLPRAAHAFGESLQRPGTSISTADLHLVRGDGTSMWCDATATNLLHDDDIAAIVINLTDVTDRWLAKQRLELAVATDEATGLPNRRGLERTVTAAMAGPECATGAVLAIAIPGLVGLDTATADDAIGAIASRIRRAVDATGAFAEPRTVIARTAPTSLHLSCVPGTIADALGLANIVNAMLREATHVDGAEYHFDASVGVAAAGDATALLRRGDLAVTRASSLGPGRIQVFTPDLADDDDRRRHDVGELTRALHGGRLRLLHQPILDRNGVLVGTEALLRWNRGGALVDPGAFLALAEESGLILPIGAWVIDQACRDLAELRRAGAPVEWVSVNVSNRQIIDDRLPLLLSRAMGDHGIEDGALMIEIDEPVLDDDRLAGVIARLEGARVVVACRDLAADQSVFSRLAGLRIAAVKLDHGLVGQLDVDLDGSHRGLVAGVAELAAAMDLGLIAQGVETSRQADALAELGVDLQQGFHHGPPMDIAIVIRGAVSRAGRR